MRPRFLLTLIENAISHAINRGHEKVCEEDCVDAVRDHAAYLVDDFGYEIRDVSGLPSDILYALLGSPSYITKDEVLNSLTQYGIEKERVSSAFDLMIWYGIFGIAEDGSSGRFIYDFNYNSRRMKAEIARKGDEILYVTNPAIRLAL
jgi:hypothetical protein